MNYYHHQMVSNAKQYIHSNFSRIITIKNISDSVFVSAFHFCRIFKKVTGETPHQYLLSVRIEEAKRLLNEGKSVTTAAIYTGFNSLQHFSHAFSRREKMSPSAYTLLNRSQ